MNDSRMQSHQIKNPVINYIMCAMTVGQTWELVEMMVRVTKEFDSSWLVADTYNIILYIPGVIHSLDRIRRTKKIRIFIPRNQKRFR